jgi:hypothetical protein
MSLRAVVRSGRFRGLQLLAQLRDLGAHGRDLVCGAADVWPGLRSIIATVERGKGSAITPGCVVKRFDILEE